MRPYLWPVMLDGITYGIPMTTQDTGSGYPGYLRCLYNPETGLNMRFMIPVPQSALLPAESLSPEWRKELNYYEQIRDYIKAEAQVLYQLSGAKQISDFWQNHSCDYEELNSVYTNWKPGFDAGYFLYPKKEDEQMPVSKNGKAYYTKEQYEQAKYNSNAYEYARSQGYDLIRQGLYYTMKEHDSMVFTPNGTWFWNSRGVHGSALEFQMYFEGKSITEAVLTLCGEQSNNLTNTARPAHQVQPPEQPAAPTAYAFRLPEKAPNYKNLFGYLCGERRLSKGVVQEMIRQNRVYQSDYRIVGRYPVSNAVFVYQDPDGKEVGAFVRGMMQPRQGQEPYKRDAPGSDKRYGWMLNSPMQEATEVRVFEGAIDAASDASLSEMRSGEQWRSEPVDRLSLEGLGIQPLENYLKSHPQVQQITLMLDGDEPGRRAAEVISQKLEAMGYKPDTLLPSMDMKDWNEVLIETCAIQQEQQSEGPTEETENEM